jgi:hypothetical protein
LATQQNEAGRWPERALPQGAQTFSKVLKILFFL